MKIIRTIILLLILIGTVSFAAFQYPEVTKGYYDSAIFKLKALKLSLFPYNDEYFEYLTVEEAWQIINWLDAGKYDQLNSFFSKLTRQYESDYKYETRLDNAYSSFSYTDNVKPEDLDTWVDSDANNPIALTARAYYRLSRGWEERGTRLARDTSETQFKKMHYFMELAEKDATKVLSLSKPTAMPFNLLMEIAIVTGRRDMRNEYFLAGIKASPGSYVIRQTMLNYLRRNWGGSDAKMEKFAFTQQKYIDHNPGLVRLPARWFFMKANNYYDSDVHKSIALHTEALSYDRYWMALRYRGQLYTKLGKYDLAIDDLNESMMRNPYSYRVRTARADVYIKTGKYELAEEDLLYAMKYWPDRFRAYYTYTDLLRKTSRHKKALSIIEKAKRDMPDKQATWLIRQGMVYLDLKQYQNALDVLKLSIEIDPDNSYPWNEISIIYLYKIKNIDLAIEAAKNALALKDTDVHLYNYATALYKNNDRLALDVYQSYLDRCSRVTCDKSRYKWAKSFMTCVNKEKSCDFDRHEYEKWL